MVHDLRQRHPRVQGRALERLHGFYEVVKHFRRFKLALATLGALASFPALACGTAPFEKVFHDEKPVKTPLGFQAFLVSVPKMDEQDIRKGEVRVKMAPGQPMAYGLETAVVRRAITSSCGTWGRTGSWAYVVGILSAERNGTLFITPLEYGDDQDLSPLQ